MTPGRIDVHQHAIPDFYRAALADAGIDAAGGRDLPAWSTDQAQQHMAALDIATALLSISTPGVAFLHDADQALTMARRLNDHVAEVSANDPARFGWFATLPLPDVAAAAGEAARALDAGADGVTLLANNRGSYLGSPGQEALFEVLDDRAAVAFIHPAELPAPAVEGIPPFAADFLLDTTRAAYLLVRNEILHKYPRIRFVLSHAGGFVPYTSHRMAVTIAGTSGRSPLDVLEDFRSFWFDTALSSSPAALPTLLAFARPERIVFGSDWPFAPTAAGQYFADGLDTHDVTENVKAAINRANAVALFPRLGGTGMTPPRPRGARRVRLRAQQIAARAVFRLVQPS